MLEDQRGIIVIRFAIDNDWYQEFNGISEASRGVIMYDIDNDWYKEFIGISSFYGYILLNLVPGFGGWSLELDGPPHQFHESGRLDSPREWSF